MSKHLGPGVSDLIYLAANALRRKCWLMARAQCAD